MIGESPERKERGIGPLAGLFLSVVAIWQQQGKQAKARALLAPVSYRQPGPVDRRRLLRIGPRLRRRSRKHQLREHQASLSRWNRTTELAQMM